MKRLLAVLGLLHALVLPAQGLRLDDLPSFDGYTLDLVVPQGPGPWPVLVLLHGGSYQSGDKRDLRPLADALARQGVASVSPNFPLGVPDADTEIGTQAFVYPHVRAAFAWIADHAATLGLDPQRVFVGGASSGGHMAMAAGILYPLEPGPTVGLQGAVSLFGGIFSEGLSSAAVPLLLVQGTADRACLPEVTEAMAAQYRAAGARCRVVLIEGMGHDWGGFALDPIVKEVAGFVASPATSVRPY